MTTPPIARAIVLTDAGAVAYTDALAAYDNTVAQLGATAANTLGNSTVQGTKVAGLAALVVQLDATNAGATSHLDHIGA